MILALLVTTASGCDGARAWQRVWDALGAGVVPEIPTGDLVAATVAAHDVATCPARPWHPAIVAGELELLRGRPVTATRAAEAAATVCGTDASCNALATELRFLAAVDTYSSFGHSWLAKTVTADAPDLLIVPRHEAEALASAVRAPEDVRSLARAWYAAAALRNPRATVRSAWSAQPDLRTALAGSLARGLQPLGDAPELRLLAWTLDPTRPPPSGLAAAPLLHELALAAPNGTLEELDVNVMDTATEPGAVSAQPVFPAAPAGSRGAVLVSIARAHLALSAGALEVARTEVDEAAETAGLLDLTDLGAVVQLYRAALALCDQDPDRALRHVSIALDVVQQSPGRVDAALAASGGWVTRLPRSAEGETVADRYLVAVAALASDRGRIAPALELAARATEHAAGLQLWAETLRRATMAHHLLDRADERIAAQRETLRGTVPDAWLELIASPSQVAMRRMNVRLHVAVALANLGVSWAAVRSELDAASADARLGLSFPTNLPEILKGGAPRAGDPTPMLTLLDAQRKSLELLRMQAAGDNGKLVQYAVDSGLEHHALLFRAMQGDPTALAALRSEIDDVERTIGDPRLSDRVREIGCQDLRGKRELYVHVSAMAMNVGDSRAQMEALQHGPCTVAVPDWQAAVLEATVLELEGDQREAGRLYVSAMERLREDDGRLLPAAQRDAEEDAWLGAARTVLKANPMLALDRTDELRWRRLRRALGLPRGATQGAPDAVGLARSLGDRGTIVVIAPTGRVREVTVWVVNASGSIEVAVFQAPWEALSLSAAVAAAAQEPESSAAPLPELDAWLAPRVPPRAPMLLVTDVAVRNAGIHLLRVGGTRWALRNPILWSPSLRDSALASDRVNTGQGRFAIGMPVGAAREPTESVPLDAEPELRAQAFDRVIWNGESTRARAHSMLMKGALIHLSAHGAVDRLDPRSSGIVLSDGILSLDDIVNASMRGPTIVVSACGAGAVANPREMAPLDLAFLVAGARTVVAPPFALTRTEDASAWMRAFYASLRRGRRPFEAAWDANRRQARLISDPHRWGAYVVVGAP